MSAAGSAPDRRRTFDDVWAIGEAVPGWLTEAQARRLWSEAAALGPAPLVVEIGSHQGRSTVVLAAAVEGTDGARVVAIDPFVDGPMFGGPTTRARLEANLQRIGVARLVRLVPARSQDVRPSWDEPIDLLYVDGKHDYWTCSDDLRWTRHLRDGRSVLVHDAFSSVGVTLALLVHVLWSGTLSYVGRDGSLARFVARRPSVRDRVRMLGELPWWVRNVVVKVLLRLRLRAVARRLGHEGSADPY